MRLVEACAFRNVEGDIGSRAVAQGYRGSNELVTRDFIRAEEVATGLARIGDAFEVRYRNMAFERGQRGRHEAATIKGKELRWRSRRE